jgi:selenocysteine-specific elongation factor
MASSAPAALDRDRPRLWIDRAFSMDGAGTVVTGTLTLGSIARDDELVGVPSGRSARVRRVQTLHQEVDRAAPGSRVALNLTGVARHDVGRGIALVRPGQWNETTMVDASLAVLPMLDHDVARRGAYLAYFGTVEVAVDVRVLGASRLRGGEHGHVRLHLPHPLALLPGDRYLLRETGRSETVGGGEVLDVAPVLPGNRARPDRSIERVIAEHGWIDADELERLTGERRIPAVGRWVVDPGTLHDDERALLDLIASSGPLGLQMPALDERQRALVERVDGVSVDGSRVRLSTAPSPAHQPLLDALRTDLLSPPAIDDLGCSPDEVRDLMQRGLVFREQGVCFATEAVDRAAEVVASLLDDKPDGVTVAEIRDAMGTSRKYVIALLARLDATAKTRRRGELRIAGPRLRPVEGSVGGTDG